MKIKIKKDGCFIVPFEQYFPTIDSLKEFIKEKNEFINIESMHDRFCAVYQQLKKSDEEIKSSILDWRIVQEFEFKNKSAFKLDFWLERGCSIKEFNDWICKRRNISPVKPLFLCNKNKFKYGKYKYEQHGEPTCNLCKSKLNFDVLIDAYIIKECKNSNCSSHFNKEIESIRQLAFLPNKLFLSKNKKLNLESRVYKEYWLLNGFGYKNTLEKIEELKKQLIGVYQNTAEYYEVTLGISEEKAGLRMKQQSHWSIEHWDKENSSNDEIKVNIQNLQRTNSSKCLEKRKNDPGAFSATTQTQIGYWLNKGLSIDEANIALSKRQTTFSKDICIEKYGEEEGVKRFNERQKRWTENNKTSNFSKVSQKLFWSLLDNNSIDIKEIYFATYKNGIKDESGKNHEYRLDVGDTYILPDFFDKKNKKIIEFDGVYYHRSTPENSKRETERDILINNSGYKVLHINENEYKKNKQEVINKCLSFLNII